MEYLITILKNFKHLFNVLKTEVIKLTRERKFTTYLNEYVTEKNIIHSKPNPSNLEKYKKHVEKSYSFNK